MELMRGLAFIALLFAGSAVGAELRQAEVCGDGTTHQAGYCPAVLSSASCSATGATTGSCSATSDETDGTRYVCATSNNTALTGAEIEACSGGAAIAGSSAAETGSNSVSLSGLTTDAAHYGQTVNKSPEQWYSNRLVPSSFTPSGAAQTNAQRISTLLAGRSPHFAYNAPTDPTTTSTCNAGSASAFNACAAVDGTEITVTGSFSGSISIMADDIDVLMDNAYTITGELNLGSFGTHISRARWTGGNISGALNGRNFDNVLFDDVLIDSGSSPNNLTANSNRIVNLAFINSTIQNDPGGRAGSSWAIFIQQNPNGGVDHQGLIFGNTKVISSALHAWRIQSFDDVLIFDSVGNPTGAALSGLRIHYNSDDVWVADTWVRGAFHVNQVGSESGPSFTNGLFDNFDRYAPDETFGLYAYSSPLPNANDGTIQNSTLYNTAGSGTVGFTGMSNGGGNGNASWDESTVPSYSAVGAVR